MSRIFEPQELYKGVLFRKFIDFASRIIKLYKYLIKKEKSIEALYQQLLKSGTSIGANIAEAQSASFKKILLTNFSFHSKKVVNLITG